MNRIEPVTYFIIFAMFILAIIGFKKPQGKPVDICSNVITAFDANCWGK